MNRPQDAANVMDECELIEMINRLQNIRTANGKMLEIPLPQIVVVGCQSAGKSGVLQSLIGREFLPQGTGVVTRRPTIIQMHPSDEAYAIFLHNPDQKIYDFEQVKQEITNETLRDPGPVGFSSNPISVKIYAPNVLKLSIVDLPGIVRNTVGDQSEDSIEEVNRMILRFIEQPLSIILAVTPATQDIATSDALEFAKRVDPERKRTLGVLTKLDLMDRGTDACAVLENKIIKLDRGYVGILNHSQQEIEDGQDIAYILQKEKRFFANHPSYSHMADRMGSPYLQQMLHKQLREHIKKTLPIVKRELSQRLNTLRRDMKNFETSIGFNNENETKGAQIYLLKVLQLFKDDMHIKIYGQSERMVMNKLTAGTLINCRLHTDLKKILALPTTITERELITLITNQNGIRNSLSIPSLSLEAACFAILKQYKETLEDFVDSITIILMEAVEESIDSINLIHAVLKSHLVHHIEAAVNKCAEETKDLLGKYLKAEMSYSNVYHWGFDTTKVASGLPCTPVKIWNSIPAAANSDSFNDSEESENASADVGVNLVEEEEVYEEVVYEKLMLNNDAKSNSQDLMKIIKDYVQLIQKQIGDVSIKYISGFLVDGVSNFINTELTAHILSSNSFNSVIEIFQQQLAQRNEMKDNCAELENALEVVQSF